MTMVKTRFAPSPTGFLHIGGARTALFSWLYARKTGGRFVLRIEDTDRERSTPEALQAILDGMAWLGLDPDEGPFYQSERFERYKEVIDTLLESGHAYRCYCSRERLDALRAEQEANKQKPRYDGLCRHREDAPQGVDPVIRFRNPLDGEVVIDDLIRGRVTVSNDELDDLIIARADGTPTYNLTVVVDDMDMQITHVIRGDDHLNNAPRQINILRALGVEPPYYAHVPMILDADGRKLSKRTGAASVMEYEKNGYLPEAVVNYLVRLGWSHGDQEIFSREEMIELFDIGDINASASALNPEKLRWLNEHYIKVMPAAELAGRLEPYLARIGVTTDTGPAVEATVEVLRDRAKTLVEMADAAEFLYRDFDDYEEKAAKKHLRPAAEEPLRAVRDKLAALDEWTSPAIHACIERTAADLDAGMGKIGQPLRVAVSGRGASPAIDVTLELAGRERTLQRIDRALAYIEARAQQA